MAKPIEAEDIDAGASWDGSLFINTGVLKAAQNDAQFAAVIAHELAHISQNQSAYSQHSISSAVRAVPFESTIFDLSLVAFAQQQGFFSGLVVFKRITLQLKSFRIIFDRLASDDHVRSISEIASSRHHYTGALEGFLLTHDQELVRIGVAELNDLFDRIHSLSTRSKPCEVAARLKNKVSKRWRMLVHSFRL
ncbi:MAG: M48 family metalloprotease [Pseudobdellovibrionaceae bacterium]|nr:M48 family metalloprotease [Pseudobdellovibrionaceae bacterium]